MIDYLKPLTEVAKAIIAKVPPWVWAALLLLAVWGASIYIAVRITQQIDREACIAQTLTATYNDAHKMAGVRSELDKLHASNCNLRVNLAACAARLESKPVPPKVVVRRVPVELEACE